MANQIKIPKEIAESVNKIKYTAPDGRHCEVDFMCSQQKDGSYLMDEQSYLFTKDFPEVKAVFEKIDFENFDRITLEQIDLK